jgi:hypothetical protein
VLTRQSIRGGLTTNRTFSYLTLSYRLPDLLGHAPFADHNQKRYADYFEAYIGAAWVSASMTKDVEHVREIENYLSQLFKPRIWPALESLTNGSTDLVTAIQFDQTLGDGIVDVDQDVSIFEIPPAQMIQTKKGKKAAKFFKQQERTRKLANITERHRQLAIVDKIGSKRTVPIKGGYSTPIKYRSQAGPSRASIMRDREAERKRQSAITNRVAMKLSARSLHNYTTPIKAKLNVETSDAGPSCKVFQLKPGETSEEEVDMDLDSEWEDIQIVAAPAPGRLTRVDRYVGVNEPGGTAGIPIVM